MKVSDNDHPLWTSQWRIDHYDKDKGVKENCCAPTLADAKKACAEHARTGVWIVPSVDETLKQEKE